MTHSKIDTTSPFNLTAGEEGCENYNPCISIQTYGDVAVTWERVQILGPGIQPPGITPVPIDWHYAMFRYRWSHQGEWSSYTSFLGATYRGTNDTVHLYPSLAICYDDRVSPLDPTWHDFYRLAWTNSLDQHVYIAHEGSTAGPTSDWEEVQMIEPAQEPSLPVRVTRYPTDVLPPLMYRYAVPNDDLSFDARITRYDFPLTPVGAPTSEMGEMSISDSYSCYPELIGGFGHVSIIRTGTSITNIGLLRVDTAIDNISTTHSPVNFLHGTSHTNTFQLLLGDSLHYQRFFRVGDYYSGDTATATTSLVDTNDYLKLRIILRSAKNDTIVDVLDTCMLQKRSGLRFPGGGLFLQSANFADSGKGLFTVLHPIFDSVYITFEATRQNPSNGYQLNYTECYPDSLVEASLPIDTTVSNGENAFKTSPMQQFLSPAGTSIALNVYPNPLRSSTNVELIATSGLQARIELFNILGNRVTTLFDDLMPQNGGVSITLSCSQLPPGTYFIRAQAGNSIATRKLLLIR